jgi:hypothetical protein
LMGFAKSSTHPTSPARGCQRGRIVPRAEIHERPVNVLHGQRY